MFRAIVGSILVGALVVMVGIMMGYAPDAIRQAQAAAAIGFFLTYKRKQSKT